MSRFVRSSKFRHVFGAVYKKEQTYDNIKVSRNAWDSDKAAVNGTFLAVLWEAQGGGSFVVLPTEQYGKVAANQPLVCGHKAAVLDIDFSPFNDHIIASASEDGYVKIWNIPTGGLTANMTDSVQNLVGHKRKVGTTDFNPTANNILATSSNDLTVKLWDIEKGDATHSLEGSHSDLIQSVSWNWDGSQLVTTCKDKKMRLIDPRGGKVVAEKVAHEGVKGGRAIFLGDREKILSVGFGKTSERQFSIWDSRKVDGEPLAACNVDTASGLLVPYFDQDTAMLYLAGKGDGNVRYYEITDEGDIFYFLSEFKSATPQRGMAWLSKRHVDVNICEVARAYKLTGTGAEPISFQVPRKSDMFQDDLYPDTVGGEPTLSAQEWVSGRSGKPSMVKMAPGFTKKATTTEFNPTKKEEEKQLSESEVRAEHDKLKNRVAYLEAELAKRESRIKELEGR